MAVSVSKAEDVAKDGDGGSGTRVGEPLLEPDVRVLEAFQEEVTQHGVELVADAPVCFNALVDRFRLGICNVFAALVVFEVSGEMALVCWHEIVVQRDSIGHEFNDAGCGCQGKDFVGSNTEIPLARGSLGFQKIADLFEDLLHNGVLSEVILTTFELRKRQLAYSLEKEHDLLVACTSAHRYQRR